MNQPSSHVSDKEGCSSGREDVGAPSGTGSREPSPAVSTASGFDPSRDTMIEIGGKEYVRFHPTHKKIKDGTLRCISCGQIDEPDCHERQWCPGMGGWLPFPTSSLKLKLRADSGFSSEETHRITLEQWVLISRILAAPEKVSRDILDQDGEHVGYAYNSVQEFLKVEAFRDDNGTAWVPPTAWAYYAACRALHARDSDGSGGAGETSSGSTVGDSAGPQDIAETAAEGSLA